jgi:hypothetical protein
VPILGEEKAALGGRSSRHVECDSKSIDPGRLMFVPEGFE